MEAKQSILQKYGYLWVTLVFFLLSILGHWFFAWQAYMSEQNTHQQEISMSEYITETLRDTFENWQSEFLQLMWQVGGLAILLYVGSPQSKDSEEKMEQKLDLILHKLDAAVGANVIKETGTKTKKAVKRPLRGRAAKFA